MTSTVRPTRGKVWLTDRAPYKDASDHSLLQVTVHLDDVTTAQVATFNVRLKSLDKLGIAWDRRKGLAAEVMADSGASVIALQECELSQASYLLSRVPARTGDPWKMIRPSNVAVMYKSDRWKLLTERRLVTSEGNRRLLLLLLRSVKTGEAFWFGSCHLSVGFPLAPLWRRHQASQIVEQLKMTVRKDSEAAIESTLFGDIRERTVMMGDFNDWASHTSAGVRQVFSEADMFEQRVRLSDEEFDGDTWRTNHSFRQTSLRDSRQIDAVFTSRGGVVV